MAKIIPLPCGRETVVDDADYEWLMQWRWHANIGTAQPRVQRWRRRREDGMTPRLIRMHRQILDIHQSGNQYLEVDHANGKPLDNRRVNLRVCSHLDNSKNMKAHRDSTSRYIGVSYYKRDGVWIAQFSGYLGRYGTELEAALARDAAAKATNNPFVRLNFPEPKG